MQLAACSVGSSRRQLKSSRSLWSYKAHDRNVMRCLYNAVITQVLCINLYIDLLRSNSHVSQSQPANR